MGFWVEIVTLLIPGFNDSRDELTRLTEFIARVSPDIPWHVTAFHGDYKMTEPGNTTAEMLLAAAEIGRASRACATSTPATCPARSARLENTRCTRCGETLVERYGYFIRAYRLTPDGRCPAVRDAGPGPLEPRSSTGRSRPGRFCRVPGVSRSCDCDGCAVRRDSKGESDRLGVAEAIPDPGDVP